LQQSVLKILCNHFIANFQQTRKKNRKNPSMFDEDRDQHLDSGVLFLTHLWVLYAGTSRQACLHTT